MERPFTAEFKSRRGGQDSVHVLVHVRIWRYCRLLRHPAKYRWPAGLLFYASYADSCVDVQLAATIRVLDSKSADRKVVGVRPPPGTKL